jgi:exonuclease SbcC
MKIKSLYIARYGPLSYEKPIELGVFNLFYGNNEDGKTLTIDALVKLLLSRKVKEFKSIDRVDEIPDGFVVLEDSAGKEIKLPQGGDLTSISGLSPSECCNIFIIRNSDLSIAKESEFYTNLTDRLTGLRMEEIAKVKGALIEEAKVTQGGTFRDIKGEKLKTRIEEALGLIQRINEIHTEIEKEKYDTLVQELVSKEEKAESQLQQIREYEDARKRENYEKGTSALHELEEAESKVLLLKSYNESDEERWRASEREVSRLTEENRELKDDFLKKETEIKNVQVDLDNSDKAFTLMEEKKEAINGQVIPKLEAYEQKSTAQAAKQVSNSFYTAAWITASILAGLAITGIILKPALYLFIPTILFSIGAILFGGLKFIYLLGNAWLSRVFLQINSILSRFGLNADTIEGVRLNLQNFDDTYRRKKDELDQLKVKVGVIQNNISTLKNTRIPELEKMLDKERMVVDDLKRKSGVSTSGEYAAKVSEKRTLNELIKRQESVLESLFGGGTITSNEEKMAFWKKKIDDLEEYSHSAEGLEYNEKLLEQLKNELSICSSNIKEIKERMERISGILSEIGKEANRILNIENDYLNCETSLDLQAIKERLQDFIDENETMKKDALQVLKIFEEIESEKKEKVSGLFGNDTAVCRYFKEITEGRYTEVLYRTEESVIEVLRSDGKVLSVDKLSAGAYDQLYLSIRLALGESLLKDRRGFFIMDDPFLRADTLRLSRQLETLRKISALGWQILYFSAKEEVKERLIKHKDIVFIQLPGTFSLDHL